MPLPEAGYDRHLFSFLCKAFFSYNISITFVSTDIFIINHRLILHSDITNCCRSISIYCTHVAAPLCCYNNCAIFSPCSLSQISITNELDAIHPYAIWQIISTIFELGERTNSNALFSAMESPEYIFLGELQSLLTR